MLIPQVASQNFSPAGHFVFDRKSAPSCYFPAESLNDFWQGEFERLGMTLSPDSNAQIVFIFAEDLPPEGYEIEVAESRISFRCRDSRAEVWAWQTFLQLLPPAVALAFATDSVEIPAQKIVDAPRYAYRGLHLDVCRHFFTLDEIKKILNAMAMHKLNVFHWHLTDDQGWRLEIQKYPRLTTIGAQRAASPKMWQRTILDGTPYGPFFYTQAQAREIVAYAKARGITVIPEIELPGHAQAALAAYPEFGCTGGPYTPWCHWGISEEVYCPGNDDTLHFLKNVLNEVMDVFDSEIIHIGGDECLKTRWAQCPKCQARMTAENLKSVEELQSWFVTQIGKHIRSKNRQMMGWDEILEGGLPPDAIVMSWQGTKGGLAAIAQKHPVVMTPNTALYFDYGQAPQASEPESIGGSVPLETVYQFHVDCECPAEDAQRYILGAQANCWSEYFFDATRLEYAIFPRLAALAEITWADPKIRHFPAFCERLKPFLIRYKLTGVNYRPLEETL